MGFLTKYGSIWGVIPQTTGNVYWVSPSASYTIEGRTYSASDNHDGLSPERAVRTVSYAVNTLAGADDVVVLLPGDHTTSVSLAMDSAGMTLMGLPIHGNLLRPRTTLTTTATADQIVNVTAANCQIAYLRLIPITAAAAVDVSAAGDNLWVHHCSFDMATPAASTSTLGVDAIGAADHILVEECYFESDGAQGAGVDMTATLDSIVRDCIFAASAGTWAAALTVGAATDRLLIQRCQFLDFNGTITAGVDGTGASVADSVTVLDCRFGENVTVPIDNFDAGECQISNNYDCGIGSTDGGVLITAIT